MQLTVARIGLSESSEWGMTIILYMKIENVRDESWEPFVYYQKLHGRSGTSNVAQTLCLEEPFSEKENEEKWLERSEWEVRAECYWREMENVQTLYESGMGSLICL